MAQRMMDAEVEQTPHRQPAQCRSRPRVPVGGEDGDVGLARRAAGRDRLDAAGRVLAEVPDALPPESLSRVPKSAQPWVSTLVRTIFEQPDAEAVFAQHRQVVAALEAKFPAAAEHLDEAREDILAFAAFPKACWRQIWSNNPQKRLNKEIRRRTDVVGIFPDRTAIIRPVGAVLAEQNDEWTEQRRYMGVEILNACQKTGQESDTNDVDVTIGAIDA
jgi:hypothetical protein